jgi:hypothetical protein
VLSICSFECWETLVQFFEWSQVWLGSNFNVCLSMAIFNLPCPVIPGLTFLRVMQSIVFGKRNRRKEGGRGYGPSNFRFNWT